MNEYKFIGNIILEGRIRCKTALHIGGAKDAYEIGGMDNPVIKTLEDIPYIPGSSLKGKLRSLLEWIEDKLHTRGRPETEKEGDKTRIKDGRTRYGCRCGKPDCPICRVFGSPAESERTYGPSRLIVRDAFPDQSSLERFKNLGSETELKYENAIDRISGKAEHPRPVERVPEGTEFEFSMVYSIYEIPGENERLDIEFFPYIFKAMALLEDSYLGGMGTRGSGQVEFKDLKVVFRSKDYYLKGDREEPVEGVKIRMTEEEKGCLIKKLKEVVGNENPRSQT
ncbi:MAG: type III-A CRISPR-associated RAMP protein Csm3 [candidate division WOR-3 bacterium]